METEQWMTRKDAAKAFDVTTAQISTWVTSKMLDEKVEKKGAIQYSYVNIEQLKRLVSDDNDPDNEPETGDKDTPMKNLFDNDNETENTEPTEQPPASDTPSEPTKRPEGHPGDGWLSGAEAAEKLGVARSTIYARVREGLYPASDYKKVGRHLYIREASENHPKPRPGAKRAAAARLQKFRVPVKNVGAFEVYAKNPKDAVAKIAAHIIGEPEFVVEAVSHEIVQVAVD